MHAFILAGFAATSLASMAMPASAQQYPSNVPVCLQVYDIGGSFTECRYASIPQCQASASGRSAQCIVNPFFNPGNDPRASRGNSRRIYSERY